jgi:hypothetical protein
VIEIDILNYAAEELQLLFLESGFGARHRSDLDYFHEYVWLEVTTTGGRN